jgi:hypothetical protein
MPAVVFVVHRVDRDKRSCQRGGVARPPEIQVFEHQERLRPGDAAAERRRDAHAGRRECREAVRLGGKVILL